MPIRVTIWLRSGEVLVLTGRPADGLRAYLAQRSLWGLAGGALLLLVLWLALRQTTQPLKRLPAGSMPSAIISMSLTRKWKVAGRYGSWPRRSMR